LRQSFTSLAAVALVGLVAGCTSGNSGIEPPFTAANLSNDKVGLNVGVATYYNASAAVTQGLNVVATFRQPNGLSATLLNTPSLTGPFTVPAVSTAGTDAGTNHLSGSPQALPGTTAIKTTFGQNGGVFAYGFAPENSTTSGAANYAKYALPFFDKFDIGSQLKFIGGPPAYPNTQSPSYPAGFQGFPMGFTIFGGGLLPVAGAYSLSVNIPSANNPGATLVSNTATIANTAGLPAFAAAPTFTSDTTGGGTVACTAPAGVTETIVELRDETAGLYYTSVVQGGGAVSTTFTDKLGPISNSGAASATLAAGDSYDVQCIGVDYPAFEAGPPANVQQLPNLGTGQADITISQTATGTY
jgi:hypothetical protein